MSAIRAVRNRRAEMNVPPSKKCTLYIVTKTPEIFTEGSGFMTRLAYADQVVVCDAEPDGHESMISCVTHDATVYLPMNQLLDIEKELARLAKEKEKTEKPPGETIPRSAPLPALCGRRVGLALRLPLCLGGDLPGAGAAGDEHDGLGRGVGRGRPLAGGADAELRPRCSSVGSGRGGLAFV